MRRIAALLLVLPCLFGFARPVQTDNGAAQRAYLGFVARFWFGGPGMGHFGVINGNSLDLAVSGPLQETSPQRGWLWQYAQAWHVLVAYKQTAPAGDPLIADATAKLQSEWGWVKANWPVFNVCGAVSGTVAQGQDDSTWVGSGLVELFDATQDPAALQGAADILACAYNRWWTADAGGGLIYCDPGYCNGEPNGNKFNFSGQFGLAMIECAQRGCASAGLTNAQMLANGVALVNWVNSILLRSSFVCPQADALYWMGVYWTGSAIDVSENACSQPAQIAPGASVVQLSSNLSNAGANAKLSALYGGQYAALSAATAASILQLEVDPNGVLINDRDARTSSYGLVPFLAYAFPMLTPKAQAAWRAALVVTARSIVSQGSVAGGAFRPDWDPAWNAAWASFTNADLIDVAAGQAVLIISARKFGF